MYLIKETKAWIRGHKKPDYVVRIIPDMEDEHEILTYQLYNAYDGDDYLGKILFDGNGYWIYDGDILNVPEQEQLAKFITSAVVSDI